MANTAVLSRGMTSVTIDLVGEGGDLTFARDIGKPTQNIQETGVENPRRQDYKNAQDVFTVAGFLIGANAYADAKTLAEDIIKPRLSSPLSLDLSDLPQRSTYDVVPAGARACTLTYEPGVVDIVGVQLSLPVVQTVQGGTQNATTPSSPGSGSGIKLTRPGGTSVTFTRDTTVTREVGRPGIQLNPTTGQLPLAVDENTAAEEIWTLSGTLVDSANSDATTLEEGVFRPRFGDEALTLEFLGNQWELQQYETTPVGSQAVRTTLSAGAEGVVNVPTIELRTMRTPD